MLYFCQSWIFFNLSTSSFCIYLYLVIYNSEAYRFIIISLFSKSPFIAIYFCFMRLATNYFNYDPLRYSSYNKNLPFYFSSIYVLSLNYSYDIFYNSYFLCFLFYYIMANDPLFYYLNIISYLYFFMLESFYAYNSAFFYCNFDYTLCFISYI